MPFVFDEDSIRVENVVGKGAMLINSIYSFSHNDFKRLLKRVHLINPLPHNPDFQQPGKRTLLKTLLEKEKMMVTSIFSFSHFVFYPSQNMFKFFMEFISSSASALNPPPRLKLWFSKELSLSQTSPGFYTSLVKVSLLKTLWEMKKLLVKSIFSFSHSGFLPIWRSFSHFH